MERWIFAVWAYLVAGVSFAVGIWAAVIPHGSVWVGTMLALLGIGLAAGMSLYLAGTPGPRRQIKNAGSR